VRRRPGAYIRRRGVTLRAWIRWVTYLAAALEGLASPAPGQQTPITGPPGRGFSSFRRSDFLFSLAVREGKLKVAGREGRTLDAKREIRLILPPPPELRDEGAIEAASEIVVARNPVLSATLTRAISQPSTGSGSEATPVAGDLYLRIRKPASVDGRRRDIPANPFAASPIRSVSYPQFRPRVER
jgi:hypothetical protein